MKEKIVLRTFDESYEVVVAQAKLREHGIESWIMNKKDSAYIPIGYFELYVTRDEITLARDILEKSGIN